MRRSGLVVIALLAACNGGDDGGDGAAGTTTEAPTTTAAETTTTTAAPDPFTVPADPADIDEAYVEAVLTELERINGDALRLAVSEGLSPRITELIRSVFEPELAAVELQVLANDSRESFAGILRPPGDVRSDVLALNVARLDCISVDAALDFSAVAEGGGTSAMTRVELRPQAENLPTNPTGWVFVLRDVLPSTTELPEQCASA